MNTTIISDDNSKIYIITSRLQDKHYGMVATWLTNASLRKDELRFTLALSKFNNSAQAILQTGEFIVHQISEKDFNLAYIFGFYHSDDHNKFSSTEYFDHRSGIRVLKNAQDHAYAEVINHIKTEDRHILYCTCKNYSAIQKTEPPLVQSRLFSLLNEEQRLNLEKKYQADCVRDEIKN